MIDKRLRAAGVKPAPPADDAQFFRRVNLDLTGRIPDLLDTRDFLDPTNSEPDKRSKCMEEMLSGQGYGDHFANFWRATFIPAYSEKFRSWNLLPSFENWLRKHLRKNTPYDQMVHSLLTAPPAPDSDDRLPFYFANDLKSENLAGITAQVFLGVHLECAQCHDDPYGKWKRRQFWELAAFFEGSLRSEIGTDVEAIKKKAGRQITIPGTDTVVRAKFLDGQEPVWKNTHGRNLLADWITAKDNPFFAKATVDLVWKYFFDVSLLHPDTGQSIVHPELLEELARQFVAHGYDLKFLIRAIVHTQAYQRGSAAPGMHSRDDLSLFARMPTRALSPEQIFDSFAEAADYHVRFASYENRPAPRSEFLARFRSEDRRNGRPADAVRSLLANKDTFFAKRTVLDVTMTPEKTAVLSESARQNINVSLHTLALSQNEPLEKRIGILYLLVLSRPPRPDERQLQMRYIQDRARDPRHAFADVYRGLLSSEEFLVNH